MSTVRQSLLFLILVLIDLLTCVSPLSIGSTSDNVTDAKHIVEKREANPQLSGDVFPDWVPFKNKHGEELGEFVQVPKAKPKKRLALPMNFKLRAVAEPQDDYFDKVQAEGEGETDFYENKDWNGATEPLQDSKDAKVHSKSDVQVFSNVTADSKSELHKEISEIDGVVSIIKSIDPNSVALEKNILTTVAPKTYEKLEKNDSKEEIEGSKEVKLRDNNEEDTDYDETKNENSKENQEAIAKKAFILNSVDELKERHANEQKYISEKAKEEERFIEELERDTIRAKNRNKQPKPKAIVEASYEDDYDDDDKTVVDKYKIKPRLTTTTPTTTTLKKRISSEAVRSPRRKETETGKLSVFRNPRLYMIYNDDETESPYRKKTTKKQRQTSTTTDTPSKARKFSSRYVDSPASSSGDDKSDSKKEDTEVVERIAFVPEKESNNGEPTLFFPKRRKVKKYKTTTTIKPDTNNQTNLDASTADVTAADATASGSANSVSNTVPIEFFTSPNAAESGPSGVSTGSGPELTSPTGFSASDHTASDSSASAPSASTISDTTASSDEESASKGSEAASGPSGQMSNSIEVVDSTTTERVRKTPHEKTTKRKSASERKQALVARLQGDLDASSTNKHKKEDLKDEGGDHEHESGGGKEYHTEHDEEHGEHGKKAYEGHHEDTKHAKGHHDKEDHQGDYHDHGGHDKLRHDESGHYGAHHHEEHGKKHAKYEESGKHSKGHSTKGSHDVHKKDEYEKKVEFFEEDGDSAEEEKHGGFNEEKEHSSGGKYKKGKLHANSHAHHKGDSGHFAKGGFGHGHKGHKHSGGHDSHGKRAQAHFEKEAQDGGKKWVYHHGHPAKTANLVVIDRRQDTLYNGPQYFG